MASINEGSPLQKYYAAVGWSGKCGDTKNWQTKNFSLNPADSGEMWAGSSAADVQWSPAAQTRSETQKIVIRQVLLQRKWRALWRRTNLGFEQTRAQVKWCEACLMGPGADAGIHWRSSLVLQNCQLWNRLWSQERSVPGDICGYNPTHLRHESDTKTIIYNVYNGNLNVKSLKMTNQPASGAVRGPVDQVCKF